MFRAETSSNDFYEIYKAGRIHSLENYHKKVIVSKAQLFWYIILTALAYKLHHTVLFADNVDFLRVNK